MTIDGKDIYTEWGCTLLRGSFDDLLRYPSRKAVKFVDWAEADGIDPDLSVVELEPRTFRLSFLMESDGIPGFWRRYRKLMADLSAPGHRVLVPFPGMTSRARLDTGASYELPVPLNEGGNLSSFDIDLVEDVSSIAGVSRPYGGIGPRGQMAINGIDLGEFGIGCDGYLDDLLEAPGMKPPFTDGRSVDLSSVRVRHKELRLSLWMMAGGVNEFVNNYRAFFTQLSGTGNQELYINTIDGVVQVYYSGCPDYGVEVWDTGRVATRFTVTLVAPVVSWVDMGGDTRYRVLRDNDLGVLADENGKLIIFN